MSPAPAQSADLTRDRYAVIGQPVAHSRSPDIHTRFAAQTGQALRYEALAAPVDGFAATLDAFRSQGGRGCNVTVPFKFEAYALADARGWTLSPRARLAGAVNTMGFGAQPWADNTDGLGLVRDIEHNAGFRLAGRSVLLVGAGGASAGVLGPLIEAGPQWLRVVNRSVARAEELVARHADLARTHGVQISAGALGDVGRSCALVINATATSLNQGNIPVDAGVLALDALVVDMMYGPAARPFLQWAHAHGAQGRDGLGMLVEQAAQAFCLWRGVRPHTESTLVALRAAVDAGH